jgi:mono/diheme cytochrome c family protein
VKKQRFGLYASALLYITWITLLRAVTLVEASNAVRSVKRGEHLFMQSCASCHDAQTRDRVVGPGLKGYYGTHDHSARDKTVRSVLQNGRGSMPAFKNLSSSEVDDLIRYLRSL